MGPKDPSVRFGIPINIDTGQPLTDAQMARLEKIKVAGADLMAVMHECEGTNAANLGFSTRPMQTAELLLDLVLLLARQGALEAP